MFNYKDVTNELLYQHFYEGKMWGWHYLEWIYDARQKINVIGYGAKDGTGRIPSALHLRPIKIFDLKKDFQNQLRDMTKWDSYLWN